MVEPTRSAHICHAGCPPTGADRNNGGPLEYVLAARAPGVAVPAKATDVTPSWAMPIQYFTLAITDTPLAIVEDAATPPVTPITSSPAPSSPLGTPLTSS